MNNILHVDCAIRACMHMISIHWMWHKVGIIGTVRWVNIHFVDCNFSNLFFMANYLLILVCGTCLPQQTGKGFWLNPASLNLIPNPKILTITSINDWFHSRTFLHPNQSVYQSQWKNITKMYPTEKRQQRKYFPKKQRQQQNFLTFIQWFILDFFFLPLYVYKSPRFIDLPDGNSIFLSFSVPLTTCTQLNGWSKQHLNRVNNGTKRPIKNDSRRLRSHNIMLCVCCVIKIVAKFFMT